MNLGTAMENNINKVQIGGSHYKNAAYEPWDFITDLKLPFLHGNVIKYVVRHDRKNGKQDIQKSLHCVHKIDDRKLKVKIDPFTTDFYTAMYFCEQYDKWKGNVIINLLLDNLDEVKNLLEQKIRAYENG